MLMSVSSEGIYTSGGYIRHFNERKGRERRQETTRTEGHPPCIHKITINKSLLAPFQTQRAHMPCVILVEKKLALDGLPPPPLSDIAISVSSHKWGN